MPWTEFAGNARLAAGVYFLKLEPLAGLGAESARCAFSSRSSAGESINRELHRTRVLDHRFSALRPRG